MIVSDPDGDDSRLAAEEKRSVRGRSCFRLRTLLKQTMRNMSFNLKSCALLGACALLSIAVRASAQADAPPAPAGKPATLPFAVFTEVSSPSNHYTPSGWIGSAKRVKMEQACRIHPHSGQTCLRFEYAGADEWAGVVWQDPPDDWGDVPGGWNLTGAKKLTFWARGQKGGEIVTFKFGVLGPDKKYPDSALGSLDAVVLTPNWKQYSIDLSKKDLSCVKTGFAWTLTGQGSPVVFYLDDILFE